MFTLTRPSRIAEAVHRAVCEVGGSDGSWSCVRYAHAGCGLLLHLGVPVEVEAGQALGRMPGRTAPSEVRRRVGIGEGHHGGPRARRVRHEGTPVRCGRGQCDLQLGGGQARVIAEQHRDPVEMLGTRPIDARARAIEEGS